MRRLTENKIVLVTRPTRLAELIARFNTASQARFYVEHLGADFSDYQQEDENYQSAVTKVSATLDALGRVQKLDRALLPNFLFAPDDTVVVLGQDGLVANTLKYLNGQPVLGVNPDPRVGMDNFCHSKQTTSKRSFPKYFIIRARLNSLQWRKRR